MQTDGKVKEEATKMLRYISALKSCVPTAYGFTADELVKTVLSQSNLVPGAKLCCVCGCYTPPPPPPTRLPPARYNCTCGIQCPCC